MTERKPLRRNAARVLVIDAADAVLLEEGRDSTRPEAPHWWIAPGGGVEGDEPREAAARREVFEETGLELGDLGPVIHHRVAQFPFEEWDIVQDEVFFAVRLETVQPAVRPHHLTEMEQRSLIRHRWWTVEEVDATDEAVYPEELGALLRRVLTR